MFSSFIPNIVAAILSVSGADTLSVDRNVVDPTISLIEHIHSEHLITKAIDKQEKAEAEEKRLAGIFLQELKVCYHGAHQNIPAYDKLHTIKNFKPMIEINENLSLATAPVAEGCLFSGFGMRTRNERVRLHKGWDIAHYKPVDIYAAGAGKIKESEYHYQYGKMILIDHGYGVYTRYAHLDSIPEGLTEGAIVMAGQIIGTMGTTADVPVGRHLHYEILTGKYNEQWGSFGLRPVNIASPETIHSQPENHLRKTKSEPARFFFTVKPNKKRA